MEQQTIEKLMEIKKLYEAGILTKEEMEAEKAKILHTDQTTTEKRDDNFAKGTGSNNVDKPSPTNNAEHDFFNTVKEQTEEKRNDKTDSADRSLLWISIAVFGSILIVLICIVLANIKSSLNYDCSNDETYESLDSCCVEACITDDNHEYFDIGAGDNYVDYQERAETFISGLSSDTKVVASLTDDERHCIYFLISVGSDWQEHKHLYCHDLRIDQTSYVKVPYQVAGYDEDDELKDAQLVGNNLYVINTSYRCGDNVVCLNTYTGEWSRTIEECAIAEFSGNNKINYIISTLIQEGECMADNIYSNEYKSITLK